MPGLRGINPVFIEKPSSSDIFFDLKHEAEVKKKNLVRYFTEKMTHISHFKALNAVLKLAALRVTVI